METRKVLSALSYFSIIFAGFIFPLIVFFASDDQGTKQHAKKAFLSHLIPIIPGIVTFFCVIFEANASVDIPVYTIGSVILTVLVSIVVAIWNIVKGVKVLREDA